jgi:hypothetical protein
MLWLICKLSIYHVDISLFHRGYFNQLFNHVFYWLSPLPVLCWCYFAAAPYMEIPMILIRLEITMPMTEQRMMRRKMESNWITIPTWTKKHGPDGQNLTLTCSTRYLEINYSGNCFHVEYPFFVLTFCLPIYGKLNFFLSVLVQGVQQFGSDFAMIQQLFPDKSRDQVRQKFKSEEKKHPMQVHDAILHRSKG